MKTIQSFALIAISFPGTITVNFYYETTIIQFNRKYIYFAKRNKKEVKHSFVFDKQD